MRLSSRFLALLATVVLTLVLSACSEEDDGDDETDIAQLEQRLETAKTTLDEAETIDVSLTTPDLPAGVTGLQSAVGQGNHSPAFTGDVDVIAGGATVGAEVIAVDDVVYAKTGFSPRFIEIDPASLGAPDPAQLVATTGGISDLLVMTTDLTEGDQSRDGSAVLTTISGTLPGDVVQSLIPTADETKLFTVTYRLTDDDALADATIEGPFYGTEVVEYLLEATASDTPVDITAP